MSNFFNSDALIEVGEVIGNVANKVFERGAASTAIEESMKRLLKEGKKSRGLILSHEGQDDLPDDDVIDASFSIITDKENSNV